MQEYRKRLPNLDLLITFDAVARHESFTRASNELSLTQSAVSQRIKMLEQSLDIVLFDRFHKAIKLTRSGAEYHNSVVIALNHLVAASESVKTGHTRPRLRIASDIAFAGCWIAPRLNNLVNRLEGCEVELVSTDDPDLHVHASVDAAIIHGRGSWPGFSATHLFNEEVIAVCSPEYFTKFGFVDSLRVLAAADLIDLAYEKWTWMNWTIWFAEQGMTLSSANRIFRSNLYSATMEAARSGLGIALAWRYFVDPYLLDGSLVQVTASTVKTDNGYYFVTSEHMDNVPQVKAVKEWIREEIGAQQSASTIAEYDP